MDELTQMKAWLAACPHWDGDAPQIDKTGAEIGSCGLFPLGLEVLSRQENLLGQVRSRCTLRFVLRKTSAVGEAAAAWLMDLQNWVLMHGDTAPVFGQEQTVRAEKGTLSKLSGTGTGIYEVRIGFEFTKGE